MPETVKVDVGCGGKKREGFVGLDLRPLDGVDHALDLSKDRYPFEDNSVDHIYSSHFLEHLTSPNYFFSEVGRIAKPGATIEIWTPYTFSSEAFVFGHELYLTELFWQHYCVLHPDHHAQKLRGRWLLHELKFIIMPEILEDLRQQGVSLKFALKHMKEVAVEFGAFMEFQPDINLPSPSFRTTFATSRFGESQDVDAVGGATAIKSISDFSVSAVSKADEPERAGHDYQISAAEPRGFFERAASKAGAWLDRRTLGLKLAIKG